jgi:hypothetical protein
LNLYRYVDLDVAIISDGASNPHVRRLVSQFLPWISWPSCLGLQIIGPSLHLVKGSLADVLFADLVAQPSCSGLMQRWIIQALRDPEDPEAFQRLLMDEVGAQLGT